jgi:hypothetical protein
MAKNDVVTQTIVSESLELADCLLHVCAVWSLRLSSYPGIQ